MAEGKQAERGKQAQRGKQAGRGAQPDSGGSNAVAEELFRRVCDLGGLLVVAFVAPVAPSSQGGASGQAQAAFENLAAEAKARNTELLSALLRTARQSDERC